MWSIEAVSFSSLESLVGTLERRPQWRSHQKFQQILECWPQVVGDVVAVQTRPLSIQRNVLSVSTSTPVWSQNLAFQRHHILRKLSTHIPDHQLKDIRFSPAKWLDLRKSSKGYAAKGDGAQRNIGVKALKQYHFDHSEARSLWSYHPCKLTPSPRLAQSNIKSLSKKVKQKNEYGKAGKKASAQALSSSASSSAESSRHSGLALKQTTAPTTSAPAPEAAPTATPVQTFHDWAAKIQMRSQRLPKCPRCHSPTPIGELQRWSVCSLCVSQDW